MASLTGDYLSPVFSHSRRMSCLLHLLEVAAVTCSLPAVTTQLTAAPTFIILAVRCYVIYIYIYVYIAGCTHVCIRADDIQSYLFSSGNFFLLFKSWITQNVITIKTSWTTNDQFVFNLVYYNN
jgi:hypothetical protein